MLSTSNVKEVPVSLETRLRQFTTVVRTFSEESWPPAKKCRFTGYADYDLSQSDHPCRVRLYVKCECGGEVVAECGTLVNDEENLDDSKIMRRVATDLIRQLKKKAETEA